MNISYVESKYKYILLLKCKRVLNSSFQKLVNDIVTCKSPPGNGGAPIFGSLGTTDIVISIQTLLKLLNNLKWF